MHCDCFGAEDYFAGFKKAICAAFLFVLLTSLVLALTGRYYWGFGFLTGTSWCVVNFALLVKLLKMAFIERQKKRMGLLLLVKFPVLYLAGFFILASGFFPVFSLLCGLLPVLLAILAVAIYRNKTWQKDIQHSPNSPIL